MEKITKLIIEVIEEVIDQSHVDEIPNIAQEQEISSEVQESSTPSNIKKRKLKINKSKSLKKSKGVNDEEGTTDIDVPRKWERKKVQIKTLEGEFSVTVWASGNSNCLHLFQRQVLILYPTAAWCNWSFLSFLKVKRISSI